MVAESLKREDTKMVRKSIAMILTLIFFSVTLSFAQQEKAGNPMIKLISEIKKAIVFLGNISEKGELQINATGFLVNIQGIFHLITAKHVVMEIKDGKFTNRLIDDGMCAFFNRKDEKIGFRPIEFIKKDFGVKWIFHENEDVDIAIIPFGLDPQKDDVMTIPENLFLTADRLFELYDVFFLSYQPGIKPKKRISPIIRSGTISLIKEDDMFYIDATAFPGNSGSPVFVKPFPIRFGEREGEFRFGGGPLAGKFIGIVGEYLPYREIAISTQTHRPRVIFEENTGLSKVWSVTFIKQILESDEFKQQLNKLLQK